MKLRVSEQDFAGLLDSDRQKLSDAWAHRAQAERQVGFAFQYFAQALARSAHSSVLALLQTAYEDELRHATLCEELAYAYADSRQVTIPEPTAFAWPLYEGVPEAMLPDLHLIATCVFNETVAVCWLRRCLRLSRTHLARLANRIHLRDEVRHARAGWAHLATVASHPEGRDALFLWLGTMAGSTYRLWAEAEETSGLPPAGYPDHGIPSHEDTAATVSQAFETMIKPGLQQLGFRLAKLEPKA